MQTVAECIRAKFPVVQRGTYLPVREVIQGRSPFYASDMDGVAAGHRGIPRRKPCSAHSGIPEDVLARDAGGGGPFLHCVVVADVPAERVALRKKHPEMVINVFVQSRRSSGSRVRSTDGAPSVSLCCASRNNTIRREVVNGPYDHCTENK
jgi:hypothetical protein